MDAPPPIATPPRMSRWRRVFRSLWTRLFLLVLIFCAGSVAGFSLGSVWTQNWQQEKLEEIIKKPPSRESISERLKTSLNLTDAQFPEVQNVISRHHAALEKIRQQVAPMYVAVFDEMDQEMKAILTESQREIWKKKAAGMREFWEKGRPPGGRGDRGKRGGEQRSDDRKREKPVTEKSNTASESK
ncbi:MAG: hypothetical protein JWM11_4666 [Planctomycetaceae bacterium]|nr:hypothetical protein [Planctomycetaceae bacterium]